MKKIYHSVLVILLATLSFSIFAENENVPTRVITLGTGAPNVNAGRAGAATAVVIGNKKMFLFDAGSGFMENFGQFTDNGYRDNVFPGNPAYPTFMNKVFITHLDSDHITGLPDVLLRGWVLFREEPVTLWGPPGLKNVVDGIINAYQVDIQHRLTSIPLTGDKPWVGIVNEIEDLTDIRLVYKDDDTKIFAFPVKHGNWRMGMSLGYRIEAPDKVIVISGDLSATLSDKFIEYAKDADILVHEVMSEKGLSTIPEKWWSYMRHAHTTTKELAEVAHQINPRKLVLTHVLCFSAPESAIEVEMDKYYRGNYSMANDGDVFE